MMCFEDIIFSAVIDSRIVTIKGWGKGESGIVQQQAF